MIRSITIFSFFALATILVIVLQPGPRPAYVFEESLAAPSEATRNEVTILNEPEKAPMLQAPDDVLAKLKAAARSAPEETPEDPEAAAPARSVDRLQAALNASLGVAQTATDAAPEPAAEPAPQPSIPSVAVQAVNPDLRAMSWQTLNALNGIGSVAKAPGQEGSLLNSIVRRSMGQVTGQAAPVSGPVGAALTTKPQQVVPQAAASQGAEQTYVVEPGDTLALISIKLYGSALASSRLLDQNPALKADPNALRIGQVLRYRVN